MSTLPYVFGAEPVRDGTQLNANFDALTTQIAAAKGVKNIYYTYTDGFTETANNTYNTILSLTVTPTVQLYHLIIAKYNKFNLETSYTPSISTNGQILDGETVLDASQAYVGLTSASEITASNVITLFWYGQFLAEEHTITLRDFAADSYEISSVSNAKLLVVQFSF